jgi:hypothetical protein
MEKIKIALLAFLSTILINKISGQFQDSIYCPFTMEPYEEIQQEGVEYTQPKLSPHGDKILLFNSKSRLLELHYVQSGKSQVVTSEKVYRSSYSWVIL